MSLCDNSPARSEDREEAYFPGSLRAAKVCCGLSTQADIVI